MLTWRAGARKADVARGTRVDAMQHAVPHGRAVRAHVRHRWRTGRGHVAWDMRVHADARVAPRGRWGWQVKGPRVSGHWLEVWGGNANAFSRPTFYTSLLPNFLPCGTMSLRKITFGLASESSDEIAGRRSRGCDLHHKHVREIEFK